MIPLVPQSSDPQAPEQRLRPGGWSVVLFVWPWLIASLLLVLAAAYGMTSPTLSGYAQIGLLIAIGLLLVVLACGAIIRDTHEFCLSDERISAQSGVFRRDLVEVRLPDTQSAAVSRSVLQRLFGLATIHVHTAGFGPAVQWVHVSNFATRYADIQERISRSRTTTHHQPTLTKPAPTSADQATRDLPQTRDLPVIGLVGGIGSGKTTVARAFESLGCLVIDSDVRAKAALDRPDVREQLVRWWGDGILTPEGRTDRAKVASIVFGKPDERLKLESLVHPIVRQDRARMIAEARTSGAKGVIVDAPLLFEAGVDAECDAVVFVHAPYEARLQRVQASRGWSEDELKRREKAQLPLDEKRERSGFMVDNSGDVASLEAQAAAILSKVRLRNPHPGT